MDRQAFIDDLKARAGGPQRAELLEILLQSTFFELDKLVQHGIHLGLVEVAGPEPIEFPKAVTDPASGMVLEVENAEEEAAVLANRGAQTVGGSPPVVPEPPAPEAAPPPEPEPEPAPSPSPFVPPSTQE